jgi:hypothetical protein
MKTGRALGTQHGTWPAIVAVIVLGIIGAVILVQP